ncbi:hypothetical protein [Brytella acorum]|uniref:Uncharacterized protein n=1 Tax=Brytella acorum TaxID=2959299 RepID=A0AA35UPA3_9PROT|nr:hypothetical protein [Brytella acorum]MDF3624291.1 hypothetical protein [Brytella acorum]CAI9121135.1 hypothetical protein LMG32879_001981 [Brytella acorum]
MLIAVITLAYATSWLVVADFGHLTHPPRRDDFLIGQTLATALIPLSILIGFGWRRDGRGVIALTAFFLAALLTWLWLK